MGIAHKIKKKYKPLMKDYIERWPNTGDLITRSMHGVDYVGDLTLTQAGRITSALELKHIEIYDVFEIRT